MTTGFTKYCLDANVLIEAWRKYYNPEFCPDYWKILIELGNRSRIFIPELVYDEIRKTEDELSTWVTNSGIPVRVATSDVGARLSEIFTTNPLHEKLVDSSKGRSMADPWVIAHAIHENAVVVTKEEKVTAPSAKKVKIPNVCENMGVSWINDFQFVARLGIKFKCALSD